MARDVVPSPARAPRAKSAIVGNVNWNVDPLPGALDNSTRVPSSVASRRTIDSPSPRPRLRLRAGLPTWQNSSNTRSCASAGMPIPVSTTRSSTVSGVPPGRACNHTVPSGVNFSALPTRFCKMRRSSDGSVSAMSGRPAATRTRSCSPRSSASAMNASPTSLSSAPMSTALRWTSITPASSLETSSRLSSNARLSASARPMPEPTWVSVSSPLLAAIACTVAAWYDSAVSGCRRS